MNVSEYLGIPDVADVQRLTGRQLWARHRLQSQPYTYPIHCRLQERPHRRHTFSISVDLLSK